MVSEGSKARGFAIGIIIFQVCTIISSSTGSAFYNSLDNDANNFVSFLFLCLLTMLGYGFIISSNHNSSTLGIFTTLIIVTSTLTQQPLIGTAIYKIFAGICCSRVVSEPTIYYSSGQNLLSLYSLRLSMLCASSLLLGFTAFGNKLGLLQTYTTSTIFNAFWALAMYANQSLYNHSNVGYYIFDDYGTNYIYVFGGAFALINCAFINRKPGKTNPDQNTIDQTSGYLGLIGVGFVFACFPFTGIIFPFSDTDQQTYTFYRFYEGPMNLYFGMAASVIFTYASSAFFGKGTLGIRELLLGTFSGGIILGTIAGTISNIGIVLLFGSIAGFFSGWWLNIVQPKINQNRIFDNLGAIGPILIVAVFGGMVLGPVSLYIMYAKQLTLAPLGSVMTDNIASKISVAYCAVSLVAGTLAGLLAGYSNMKNREDGEEYDFQDGRFLEEIFGLYDHKLALLLKQKAEEEKLGPIAYRKYFVDEKIKRRDGELTIESNQDRHISEQDDDWSSEQNQNINHPTTMKRQMIQQRNQS